AKDMGMSPYYMYRQKQISGNLENIGFAPEGKECLYNIEIMEELCDIVALGAGSACKKVGRTDAGETDLKSKVERCENVKDVDLYIERIDEMIERKKELFFDGELCGKITQ
nr:coproporphyrinogen dehydrogenase HemZ [Lachnospiraceae bacterium]